MLSGQRSLINSCNSLETSLDRLKLNLGLPTETPINIDLRNLESLTRRDEMEVAGELVRRARERVISQLSKPLPEREDILSASLVLLERVLSWADIRTQIGVKDLKVPELRILHARLRIKEAYEAIDRARRQLDQTRQAVPPAASINVFRRTANSALARLELVARQLQLADELAKRPAGRDAVLARYVELKKTIGAIQERVTRVLRGESEETFAMIQRDADAALTDLLALDLDGRRMIGATPMRSAPAVELQQAIDQARQLLTRIETLEGDGQAGLPTIELSVDDAMVTALVQRFELMNERSFLADDWRGIKLAADDLKSALNLSVSQSFQNRDNDPFDFSFDDAQTQLRATLDLPLNRRQQRNGFRRALINYQAGRRSLMALEDNVKFAVRQDLRQLSLDRVQYAISVVSAALASERVYSTQLELSLGLATVTARDFLESQRDYRASLSNVANGRLGYIVNRAQLALDLELMMLNNDGLWAELDNEQYQPQPDRVFPAEAGPTYGDLPRRVWPSDKIKRMRDVPPPGE